MTPTPWARAVEAMAMATPEHCAETCNECLDTMLRAALPHLMAAVVEGMPDHDLTRLFRAAGMTLYPERETFRTALLAALTDAAGRVGG